MAVSNEAQGFAAVNLAKVRRLIQDFGARDRLAKEIGVGADALLTMLQAEETRIAALT